MVAFGTMVACMVHGDEPTNATLNWTADDHRQRPWRNSSRAGEFLSGSDVQAGAASKHLKAQSGLALNLSDAEAEADGAPFVLQQHSG